MHIEISAGGLSGGIAVSSFQSGMKKYISGTDGMISSFKAVRTATYNLNGGVDRLAGAVNQVSARERTEENRKSGAENVQAKANSFLDLAVRVDKQVESMVNQDRKELYGQYPSLKPSPGQWAKDRLSDAWDWLCSVGKGIAEAGKLVWNGLKDTIAKAKDIIVDFYHKHEKVFKVIGIIAGAALTIALVVGSGGALALLLGPTLASIITVSAALGVGASAILDTLDVIFEIQNPTFQKVKSTLSIISNTVATLAIVIGSGGTGLVTLLNDLHVPFAVACNISSAIAVTSLFTTPIAATLNIADTWANFDHPLFNAFQNAFNVLSGASNGVYSFGLTYQAMKSLLIKIFSRTSAPIFSSNYGNEPMPNHENADTNFKKKFWDYSLDPYHSAGKNKARAYQEALGYNKSNATGLYNQIHDAVSSGSVLPYEITPPNGYGVKYKYRIPITGPNGQTKNVIAVYQIDNGTSIPRLITNYLEAKQ